ncbi:MAG: protein kinase, partial [Gemmatimonadaceae bacterium]
MTSAAQLSEALAGRYSIEREIGRGGMATVYLARDLRHERSVALKVLLPELGAVLGSHRFLAEIRVMAGLQHPHLLPLFDSGEANGLLYYAMPFVEGESLRARLDRERQLPVDEAVRIAVAVAGALDYAHRHGVVHRDLKPENILLQDGEPAVADFGIALAVSKANSARITQTGLSLGTPHYMSPEQATADKVIDARSDIFSLGCVLYEMLTGDPPHTGSTSQAIIAQLITERPRRANSVRPSVPANVSAAIDKALEKIPADRFATAARFAEALVKRADPETIGVQPLAGARRRRMYRIVALAALVSFIAIAATAWSLSRFQRTPARTTRMAITLPMFQRMPSSIGAIAVSRDASQIAYVASTESGRNIYLRRLDQLEARVVQGAEGGGWPFFSPDGAWLAFVAEGSLKKIPVEGGAVVTIAETPEYSGGSWGADGQIIYSGEKHALWRVPAAGGPPRVVATPDTTARDQSFLAPAHLPNGRSAIFTLSVGNARVAQAAVLSLETGAIKNLGLACNGASYIHSGDLLCPQIDGTVLAYPFDVDRLAVTGEPVSVLEKVRSAFTGVAELAVSEAGTLVYLAPESDRRLVLVNRDGTVETLVDVPRQYSHPRYSPDGDRIAFRTLTKGLGEIWIMTLADRSMSRLSSGGDDEYPEWTPDGTRVTYGSRSATRTSDDLFWRPADGSTPAEPLVTTGAHVPEGVWTPDGRTLVFRQTRKGDFDIGTLAIDGDRVPRSLLKTEFNEGAMRLSPDGRWMAYVSNESGQDEVYVRPFPTMRGRWQVSGGGGTEPVWSPDGREIFYRNFERMLVAAASPAASGSSISVGARRQLFEAHFARGGSHAGYDITPDGRRFLMAQP